MKTVVSIAPRFMRAKEAYKFLGSEQAVRDFESAKLLKPSHRGNRMTLYSMAALQTCADLIDAGKYPKGGKVQ